MINVKICRDVKSAETKLIFNLTGRQLFCSVLAIAASIGVFLLLKPILPLEPLFVIITFICAPFVAFGFVKVYGLPFEKFLHILIVNNLLAPANRKYKTENFWKSKEKDIVYLDEEPATEDGKKKPKKPKKRKKKKYKMSKLAIR